MNRCSYIVSSSIQSSINFDITGNLHNIQIGNDVWIGSAVSILGGVRIHNGAVIAANALVTKDVLPYAIVGGNPARIIKYRCTQDTIDKLNQIKWWNWSPEVIAERSSYFELSLEDFANAFYNQSRLSY